MFRGGRSTNLNNVDAIVATVENSMGEIVYNRKRFQVSEFGSGFIIDPVSLDADTYELTELFLLDEQADVTHATPKEGSELDYLVTGALPVAFSVISNDTTEIPIELVDVTNATPEQFGYIDSDFLFEFIEVFDLTIVVFRIDSATTSYVPTESNLIISADSDQIINRSLPSELVFIKLKNEIDTFNFEFFVAGYDTLKFSSTPADLEGFTTSNPLEIRFGDLPGNIDLGIIQSGPSTSASFEFITSSNSSTNYLALPFWSEITVFDSNVSRSFRKQITQDNLCVISETQVPGETLTTYGLSFTRIPENSSTTFTFFNSDTSQVAQAFYTQQTSSGSLDITDDPLGTPDCNEIETNFYSNSVFINPQLFLDKVTPTETADTLVAVCLDGANYRISIASRDLTFDATLGTILDFEKILNLPSDPTCSSYQDLTLGTSTFTELFKTVTGPPDSPEWLVQTFEVPISSICNDASITGFTVQIFSSSDPTDIRGTFDVDVATCVFVP